MSAMRILRLYAILALASVMVLMIGCTGRKLKAGEGFLPVKGGKIWYGVTGKGDKTPVLLLHGGPGYPSYYLNPLKALGDERRVITFDQLGCGRSDRIRDTTLMTVDNYVEQVKQLLTALHITSVYLYGHSWGTMLGVDYYLKYGEGVKGLVLASPCLNATMWVNDADTLISTLPDSIQRVLRNDIKGVVQDARKLKPAVKIYFNSFYTRRHPISADVDSANAEIGENVYEHMWGANEYVVSGNLSHYDRTGDLPKIDIPTLYITGEFDAARPTTVRYYQSLTPQSKLVVIKNAGHMTMHDKPKNNVKAIRDFFHQLDEIQKSDKSSG